MKDLVITTGKIPALNAVNDMINSGIEISEELLNDILKL